MALRQRIDKAWANIDVVLKQRHDQLPALVGAVRGLMAFEQDVLTEVTRARAAYSPTEPIPDQAVHCRGDHDGRPLAARGRGGATRTSRRTRTCSTCSDEIERLESMIADRRELYNDQVYRYNTQDHARSPRWSWPGSSAGRPREFFAAEPAAVGPPGHRRL